MVKKNKKMLLRTLIIALGISVIYAITNRSYGSVLGIMGVAGIGTLFVYAVQVLTVTLGLVGQGLITGLTVLGSGDNTGITGLKSIFFNHNSLTTAAYFTNSGNLGLPSDGVWSSGNVMYLISQKVTEYYYVMRNLAIAALLFVLLYIAIRMAMSTISADEAKYKKMLTNWAVSLALVFVLHFIMIVTFYISNTLVGILEKASVNGVEWNYTDLLSNAFIPIVGFGEAIIFLMLIGMELTFIFMYIKRTIVLGFLILIAPLITITYSLDKIGDGKSQALNTWLKEFIYNVIIQPFHCILYITLISTVIEAMVGKEGFGGFIIYIIVLQFVKEAENIIKKIFSIQADSMPGIQSMGTLALGAMTAFGSAAKGAKAVSNAKKMPKMNDDVGKKIKKVDEQNGNTNNTADTTGNNNPAPTPTPTSTPAPDGGATQDRGTTPDGGATPNSGATPDANSGSGSDRNNGGNSASNSNERSWWQKLWGTKEDFRDGAVGVTKFFGGPDVTAKDGWRAAVKIGSTVAAAGMGLGMGNAKDAIGLGMTAYGLNDRITDAIDSHKNNLQLEKNEEAYDEQYEEYVQEYQRLYREKYNNEIDESTVRDNLVNMFERYDDGSLNLNTEIKDKELRDLTEDFLKGSYTDLRKSYEVTGGEKPTDLAKARTTNYSSAKYEKKYPNRT